MSLHTFVTSQVLRPAVHPGALVADGVSGEVYHIPAVADLQLIDVTGVLRLILCLAVVVRWKTCIHAVPSTVLMVCFAGLPF